MKYILNLLLTTILILFCNVTWSQFDFLKELGIERSNLGSKNLTIVSKGISLIVYETELKVKSYGKCRIRPMTDNFSFMEVYSTASSLKEIGTIINELYSSLGEDDEGRKKVEDDFLNKFKSSNDSKITWRHKNIQFLTISYDNIISKDRIYPGLQLLFSSDFVPPEGEYEISINPKEVLNSLDNSTFRNTKWGMNRLEVIQVEGKPNEDSDGILVYTSKLVGGLIADVIFIFVDDVLVRSKYIFNNEHSNNNDFIKDYEKVQEILTEKYGDPYANRKNWDNDLFKEDFQNYGMAVSVGHLSMQSGWVDINSDILHSLSGENYDIFHIIQYSSNALLELEKAESKKDLLNKF